MPIFQPPPAPDAPNSFLKWQPLWSAILLPCLALTFAMTALILYSYDATKSVVRDNMANDMRAIAKLKVGQIEQWLAERRDDAQLIATAQFSHDLQHWIDSGMPDDQVKRRLLEQLTIPDTSLEPRTFTLRSATDGKVLLTTDSAADTAEAQRQAVETVALGQARLEDMHFAAAKPRAGHGHPPIIMGYFTPLVAAEGSRTKAVLHTRMSPEHVLYPLLKSWPGVSASAETMLLRKEDGKLVYLNDLRHAPDSTLRLSRPLAASRLIATHIVRDGEGFVEADDYRGIPSLAYGMPIVGTPWILIAKIDRSEAYHQLDTIAALVSALSALLLLVCTAWLFVRKREELRLAALYAERDDLYQQAPCGYHSLDKDGVFQRANETQLAMLGYTREEIIGKMNIRRLLTETSLRKFQEYFPMVTAFQPIKDVEFELIRKDGSTMPILVSASAIRDRDGRFLMTRTMVYDISERLAMEDKLRRSEERFRTLFRSIRDQVFVRESLADGTPGPLIEVNGVACEQLGYSREEIFAQPAFYLYPNPPSASELERYHRELAQGRNVVIEQTQRTKDARLIPVEISSTQLILHGQTLRFSLVRDISERKRNEEALRLLRRAIESSAQGLIITSAQGDNPSQRIIYVNPAFEQITGYSADEVLGKTPRLLQGNDRDQPGLAEFDTAMREQRVCRVTLRNFRKDGSPFWNEMLVSPVINESAQITHYVGIISDVTRRMTIEAELVQSREQLRKLASHDDGVREAERKHIARELHDELGQLLTALKMKISLLQMRFDEIPEMLEKTEDMRMLVERTIGVVRNAVSNLRPAALELGIVGALEWLADDFTRHTGIACGYQGDANEPVLDDKLATVVFRIAQESLTNVARHAAARNVIIRLACDHGILRLSVSDDGCGFDTAAVALARNNFGLLGMQERVTMLNGSFDIRSSKGSGTRIAIELPLTGHTLQ